MHRSFTVRSLLYQSLLIVVLAMVCPTAKGQVVVGDDSVKFQKVVGLKAHYGKILIHSRDLRPIKDSYPLEISIDLAWQFLGKKSWEFCNCYPRTGVIITALNFDNRPILGYGFTSRLYVEPVFLTRHRINFSVRMAGGPGYLTTPFD